VKLIMTDTSQIQKALEEALKPGTMGILSYEENLCPVTVISVAEEHVRISSGSMLSRLFSGMDVHLELCCSQGCLVLATEVLEVSHSFSEGVLLAFPTSPTGMFLRHFWRIPVNIPAEIKPHAHPHKIKVIIRNISAGGMLVESPETLEIGDSADIFFSLKGAKWEKETPFHLVGSITQVALSESPNRIGIRFVGMFPDDENKINKFVLRTIRETCPKLQI